GAVVGVGRIEGGRPEMEHWLAQTLRLQTVVNFGKKTSLCIPPLHHRWSGCGLVVIQALTRRS
ncbi:MAG: hypothetical protein ACO3FK_10075, partial [Vulcanococcus sp.]